MLPQIHGYAYKYYFRLTPKCAHRVIYRGYMRDKRNRSLGPNLDFIRAFSGYESPMLKDVNELKKRIDYVWLSIVHNVRLFLSYWLPD